MDPNQRCPTRSEINSLQKYYKAMEMFGIFEPLKQTDLCVQDRMSAHNEQVEHYSIYCFLCQQLFTDIDELQRHLFLHIQQCQQRSQSPKLPSFGCDACGRNLSSEQELQKHRKRFHASTTPRDIVVTYQCDQCDIIYLSLDFLEKHKRLHENGAHTLYNEQHISWQLAKQKYAPRSPNPWLESDDYI